MGVLIFQRLHGREAYEGTGMGLATSRKIAEHHGGEITAESKLDEGSIFIATLPIQQRKTEVLGKDCFEIVELPPKE